jgi:hypothetical protein
VPATRGREISTSSPTKATRPQPWRATARQVYQAIGAFGIDFAIGHPARGSYGIGIECEGHRHALLALAWMATTKSTAAGLDDHRAVILLQPALMFDVCNLFEFLSMLLEARKMAAHTWPNLPGRVTPGLTGSGGRASSCGFVPQSPSANALIGSAYAVTQSLFLLPKADVDRPGPPRQKSAMFGSEDDLHEPGAIATSVAN